MNLGDETGGVSEARRVVVGGGQERGDRIAHGASLHIGCRFVPCNGKDEPVSRPAKVDPRYAPFVEAGEFDEAEFYAALARGGARVLVIGRQAMIIHGVPVLTSDYDLWVHIDDVGMLNDALATIDLAPNRTPEEARQRGRYVIEGHQHVDVMLARSQSTKDGVALRFDDAWERREVYAYADAGVDLAVPCLDDLILTKRWAMREKDLPDIQLLEALRRARVGS